MQTVLPLVGSATRPKRKHDLSVIRCCESKAHACRVALMACGDSQEAVAERMDVTPGYLSMLLSGKRRWSDDLQRKFMNITGSLAPLQWDAMQEGTELYVDPINQRLAEIEAERAQLLAQRRAA